jgi:hypothetical protein
LGASAATNSAEIDRLQAPKRELLESLSLEALLTLAVDREQSWVKESSGEELLRDLLSRAMTAGEGKLLALVRVPRDSGGFAGSRHCAAFRREQAAD